MTVGYVDEEPIIYYDSELGKAVPRQQWMVESQGDDYWERNTQIYQGWDQWFKANIPIAMSRTNQTGGIHIYQFMVGCELRDDGTTSGFIQYGWDGSDLIAFDKDQMVWVTPVPWGQITKDNWDQDSDYNQYNKGYLDQECIDAVKRYVKAGESHLEPNPPEVSFTASKDGRHLSCVATGFYPQSINVTILRDDRILEEIHSHEVLPNHDNTYQLTRTVQVEPMDTAEFSCRVEHRSLPEPLVMLLAIDLKPNSIPILVIAIDVVLVILVMVIAVGVAYKKKGCFSSGNKGYNPTKTSDKGESSSNSSAMA
ncbi:major histocompatibility complex class I-related gene protein-like isoform X2 [Mobula birostris]|uniref:major histocompatibility complex class I-related gene protein-like isoform X2 n=1 Tax=Mobula birostris TaxID=1983395 RepID=UPI003B2864EA